MLTSWASDSLLFACKEGAGKTTYLCPYPLIDFWTLYGCESLALSINYDILHIVKYRIFMSHKTNVRYVTYRM